MNNHCKIVYFWYSNIKPVVLILCALVLTLAGGCILYAEFALFVGIENSLIYNILDIESNQLSYLKSIVSIIVLSSINYYFENLDILFGHLDILGIHF
jgi:hypothetical protein